MAANLATITVSVRWLIRLDTLPLDAASVRRYYRHARRDLDRSTVRRLVALMLITSGHPDAVTVVGRSTLGPPRTAREVPELHAPDTPESHAERDPLAPVPMLLAEWLESAAERGGRYVVVGSDAWHAGAVTWGCAPHRAKRNAARHLELAGPDGAYSALVMFLGADDADKTRGVRLAGAYYLTEPSPALAESIGFASLLPFLAAEPIR